MKHSNSDYMGAGFSPDWLRKNKDVLKVVDRYLDGLDGGELWSPERLRQELEATDWWRKTTEAERQFQILQAEQPAEARKRVDDQQRIGQQLASLLGVRLSKNQSRTYAQRAASQGWDEDDWRQALARNPMDLDAGKSASGRGDAQNAVAQLRQWSEQYLVPVSNKTLENWTRGILRGDQQLEDWRAWFVNRAAQLYGGVADDLRAGATTVDILQPYLEDASRELGVTLAGMDLKDAKWTAPLTGGKDSQSPLTREEWLRKIRLEKKYGYDKTWKAKNEAASLGRELQTLFGG